MNLYANDTETSSFELETTPDLEYLESAVADSLAGILPAAPIENRPALYGMLCRTKASEAAAFRQRKVDESWRVAHDVGLVPLLGTTSIQDFIVAAFSGGAL